MPEISNRTLVIAIRALAADISTVRSALADGDADPEDYQALEAQILAAEDLERAYDEASRIAINLPPYEELVRQ
jgi:hypothetical protein